MELHEAAERGDIDAVSSALERGADLNGRDSHNRTPLHRAAGNGHTGVVALLLEKDAEVNLVNNNKNTPLHLAALNGHTDVVQLLLEKDAEVNAVNNNKDTPLQWAAYNGHIAIVQLLLENGVKANAADNDESTPLHRAALKGHPAVAQLLLEKSVEINAVNKDKNTPLHWAAREGRTAVVKLLLEKSADVNVVNNYKNTPLHYAAYNGHIAVVKLLLEKGAEVKVVNNSKSTPLHWAAERVVVSSALERGADVNERESDNKTPLHQVAENGHTAVVQLLIEKGAELNAVNNDKDTPLHFAAAAGRTGSVRILLDRGANINAQNVKNNTPLHIAVTKRDKETVRLLLDSGADAEVRNKDDKTAIDLAEDETWRQEEMICIFREASSLHVAIEKGAIQVVELLLEKGADIYAKTGDYTALHLAVMHTRMDIACKLVEHIHSKDFDFSLQFHEMHNSYSDIHWAASGNDETMTLVLLKSLKSQQDLQVQDNAGNTPLHISCAYGNLQITKLLIKYNANIRATNKKENTPLHLAASRNNADVVRYLMKKGGPCLVPNHNTKIPLHLAVYHDCFDACRALVGLPDTWEMKGMKSFTALHWAVAGDDVHTISSLMATSNGEAETDFKDELGRTPMHIAVDCNNTKALTCLIKCRPNTTEERDEHGDPILFTAYRRESKNVFECLLHHHANIRNRNGDTILHLAVRHNDISTTSYLKHTRGDTFPELICEANIVGDTALHLAVAEDNSDIVRILLDNGGDTQASNRHGKTPIDIAKEKPQISYMLGESLGYIRDMADVTSIHTMIADSDIDSVPEDIEPANVKQQMNSGRTLLRIASEKGCIEKTTLLVEYDSDISKVYSTKISPIHFAVRPKAAEILAYLLAEKANRQDLLARTPLKWAKQVANADDVEMLLGAGENVYPFTIDSPNTTSLNLLVAFATSLNENEKDTISHFLQSATARGQKQDVLSMVSSAVTVLLLKAPQVLYPTMSFLLSSGFNEILCFPVYISNQLDCYSKEDCVRWSTHTLISALTKVLDTSKLRNLLKIDEGSFIHYTNFLRQNTIHLLADLPLTPGEVNGDICEKIAILNEAGVNIDELDVNDRTPLHLACRNGNLTNAHNLLTLTKKGSRSVLGQDVQGRTSLDYLMRHYTSDIDRRELNMCIALLIDKGAISRRVVTRPLAKQSSTRTDQPSIYKQTGHDATHPTELREQNIDQWLYDIRRDQRGDERRITHCLKFNDRTDSTVLNDLMMQRIKELVHQLCHLAMMQMEYTLEFKDVILSGSMCEGTKVGDVDEMDFLLRMTDAEQNMVVDGIEKNFAKIRRPNIVENEVNAAGLALRILQNILHSVPYVFVLRDIGMSIEDIRRNKLKVFTLILTATDINGDDKEITVDVVPTIFKKLSFENLGPHIAIPTEDAPDDCILKDFPLLMKDQGFEISFSELEHEAMKSISRTAIQAYKLLKLMRSPEICPRLSSMKPHVGIEDVVTSYTFKQSLLWVVDPYGRRDKCEELKKIKIQLPSAEKENDRVRLLAVQVLGLLLNGGMDTIPLYFCPSDKLRLTHNCKLICRIIKGLLE